MAKNDGKVTVYSKATGRKSRIPEHWVDNPVLGARFEKTPRQRDADAKSAGSAGGTRADHPDEPTATEPTAAQPTPEPAPAQPAPKTPPNAETDTSEPAAKKKATSSTETPATRGEE